MVLLGYAALALVGVGCYLAYAARPMLVLLPVAVVTTSLAVPQVLADLADDQLGADGVMTMSTLALAASILTAWRLREERHRDQAREMSHTAQP